MDKKNNHRHPVLKTELTFGQKASDRMTKTVGSWSFILGLFIFLTMWIMLNTLMVIFRWDLYPFILLNFVLSTLAAIQAPIILMSQNRQTERDRITFGYDYSVNRKAEREISNMQKDLTEIKNIIKKRL